MRGLLVLGFLLAIAAVSFAVFSDDVRLLKLAALLGVWAALATAFPVVYFRRSARSAEQKTEESKRTYELELHREISARREYEIGVSEAARENAETRHREELAGLREQLDRLNTTLSGLLDGDLLFERLTLSAESTRVRQVGGESGRGRLSAMARPGQIAHVPESTGPYVGQRSGAPVAAGMTSGTSPVREDDTVQFARATFGPGAPSVAGAPVEPAVVEAPVTAAENNHAGPVEPKPESVVEPEPVVEPELVVEPKPEPVVEPEPEPVVGPKPEPEPVAIDDSPPGHPEAETGHSAGISVADLLAAYGGGQGTPRRRRRSED